MGTLIKHAVLRRVGNSYGIIIAKVELERIKIPAVKGQPIWVTISDKPIRLR